MGRTQQMRRDLITVALIVSLLVAALLLTGSKEAFAQSAAEDQYSDPSSVPASPAPTSTPGSGGAPSSEPRRFWRWSDQLQSLRVLRWTRRDAARM
jgi:hypothetical protein